MELRWIKGNWPGMGIWKLQFKDDNSTDATWKDVPQHIYNSNDKLDKLIKQLDRGKWLDDVHRNDVANAIVKIFDKNKS